jgi:predicted O-methyltransferase YrrM
MRIAEIGCWTGLSTAVLANAAKDRGGLVYAVDHWRGNQGVPPLLAKAQAVDVFAIFRRNLAALGLADAVRPMVMDSESAAAVVADGLFDLVFIDADHRYSAIRRDLDLWLPKVRPGGVLCGHDCEGYYDDFAAMERQRIDAHLEDDFIPGLCHPGVVKALSERFRRAFRATRPSLIWIFVRER